MKIPAALPVAALMMFAADASVATAQLSSRSANGGLFGSLVAWEAAPTNNGHASPWAASRVQLGSVRAADPNAAWMGTYGQDRGLGAAISAERQAAVYWYDVRGTQTLFVGNSRAAEVRRNDPPADLPGNGPRVVEVAASATGDVTAGLPAMSLNGLAPLPAVTIGGVELLTTAPEPATYYMAAVGLIVIALIRRTGLA